ncbi:MAG: hypothetical protein RLZZ505_225 [Verrucomicrobiota bacterium]|jgi:hypothetical protein
MRQWYYTKVGLQQGPVPETELLQKIRRGEIGGSNLVWHEGMPEWTPLSQMPELMGGFASPVTALPQPVAKPEISLPPRESPGSVPLPQPPAYHGNYVAPVIPTYMWQSVVATVLGLPFCCILAFPFGIVAIVFAAKVEGLRVQGDIFGATTASNNAKTWMIISFVCSGLGLLMNLVSLIVTARA